MTSTKYWAAVKAGRTFATSGPMLTMTVNGRPLGTTITRTATDNSPVIANAHVRSINRLESLQLVHDGKVIRQLDLTNLTPDPVLDHTANWHVSPKRSGWLAARALFRAPDGRLRQAHTSPIYVVIDNQPIAHKADAQYMIRWIDRLVELTAVPDHFPTADDRQQVQQVYQRARTVYEKVAADAARVWGD